MVRLKVFAVQEFTDKILFQFLMVRLKDRDPRNNPFVIEFQFLMVRLKGW